MHLSCQKQAEKYLKHTILAILFKKPTYLKNPWVFSFKKPILPAGFLNGFFKWFFYLIQPWHHNSKIQISTLIREHFLKIDLSLTCRDEKCGTFHLRLNIILCVLFQLVCHLLQLVHLWNHGRLPTYERTVGNKFGMLTQCVVGFIPPFKSFLPSYAISLLLSELSLHPLPLRR